VLRSLPLSCLTKGIEYTGKSWRGTRARDERGGRTDWIEEGYIEVEKGPISHKDLPESESCRDGKAKFMQGDYYSVPMTHASTIKLGVIVEGWQFLSL
jgi:hypothetical protein